MKFSTRSIVSTLALLAIAGSASLATLSYAGPPEAPAPAPTKMDKPVKGGDKDKAAPGGAAVGTVAPAFALKDVDGKDVKLDDFKGKVVVIEWFNPGCPYIVYHHGKKTTFNDLHKEYKDKGVVFLAINSSAKGMEGNGVELNKKMRDEWKIAYPILIDEDGKTGRAYQAKTTPHMFVIGKDGKVAYNGAIDNDSKMEKSSGATNHVKAALDEILADKPVTTSSTKPYGCGVKYAK
jgi:peroxiredoxin